MDEGTVGQGECLLRNDAATAAVTVGRLGGIEEGAE